MNQTRGLRLAVDIGGTFTDTVLMDHSATVVATSKVATTPAAPAEGALHGVREAMRQSGADLKDVTTFIHGTTLATNALIERRGARVATITTEGFRDILEIAYERRYAQYDINIEKPDLIVPRQRAFTIGGRMDARGNEVSPLCEADVPRLVQALRVQNIGAVAICLLHSYANPTHERRLQALLQDLMPGVAISVSHDVSPEAREFDRLCTTIANAFILPLMADYLADFETRFAAEGLTCPVLMMTAGGGMTTLETAARLPIRLVESGPAGGAILAARLAASLGARDVLSFDMGGTTAKLCLIDDFRPQSARKFEIARADRFAKGSGMPVRIPVVDMIEIGAGGGSIADVDGLQRVRVGPQSAGADPGPAGFGKGGMEPTVTDADILQGYIPPEHFAEGRLGIDAKASRDAMGAISAGLDCDVPAAATAVSETVDEAMAAAGRMHAVESGKDISARLMVAFGGNGPLHATRVARRAGVTRIVIPRDPGVGSAVGFLHAPVSFETIRSLYLTFDAFDAEALSALLSQMRDEAEGVVRAGAPEARLSERRVAFMRYHGQGHEIEIDLPNGDVAQWNMEALTAAFEAEYARQFGRAVPGMRIEVLNWGLTVTSPSAPVDLVPKTAERNLRPPTERRDVWCVVAQDWASAGVFERAELAVGDWIPGPALIVEPQTTTLVTADFGAEVDAAGNLWLIKTEAAT